MALSKIDICNIALASIGADSIRSFDEKNKRSRMCDVLFDSTRDYLLSKFNWNFARKYAELQQIDIESSNIVVPEGYFVYQLPSDCKTAIELYPEGSRDRWFVSGEYLFCFFNNKEGIKIILEYITSEVSTALFSDTFSNLLALGLAARLAPVITQDPQLTKTLYNQYQIELGEVAADDANIGNKNRPVDEIPEYDSFVTPDLNPYYGFVSNDDRICRK